MRVIDGQYGIFSPESTGVFKVDPGTNKINVTVAQNHQGDNHAFFDLSGGNSIYGSSDTVQPKTMRGYWLIRFEPNIPGSVAFRPVADFGGGDGAFLFEDGSVQTAHCALNEGIRGNYKVLSFDASRTSSLYQNGLTEIRVNALFGLNLIRAY